MWVTVTCPIDDTEGINNIVTYGPFATIEVVVSWLKSHLGIETRDWENGECDNGVRGTGHRIHFVTDPIRGISKRSAKFNIQHAIAGE